MRIAEHRFKNIFQTGKVMPINYLEPARVGIGNYIHYKVSPALMGDEKRLLFHHQGCLFNDHLVKITGPEIFIVNNGAGHQDQIADFYFLLRGHR